MLTEADKTLKDRARDLMLRHTFVHADGDGTWVMAKFPELEFEILEALKSAVAQEREACAKIADDYARDGRLYKEYACETADELAARIRIRETLA